MVIDNKATLIIDKQKMILMAAIKINAIAGSIKTIKANMLVAGVFEDFMTEDVKTLDRMMNNEISELIKRKEFKPEFRQGKILHKLLQIKNMLVLGLGKKNEFDIDKLRKASALAAKIARTERIDSFVTILQNIDIKDSNPVQRARAVTEGILLGLYKFDKYKTPEDDAVKIKSADLLCENAGEIKKGVDIGITVSDAVNYVRDLTNEPASFMTPTALAEEAKKIAKECGLRITILNKKDIEGLGMGGLLGVSKGSSQEPKIIVLEYDAKTNKKICLIGKGVTFDSGGLDIKGADYMSSMKNDKAGAAAVLGILKAASKLKMPVNVVGIIPATENMPGCAAYKPGDILKAYNKKTIEIINTDAEGRLILADAISYAEKNHKPDAIIDLATLTGACVVALGYAAAGIFGTDEKLIKKIYDAGQKSAEKVWQLPMWEEYKDYVKSEVADVKNASGLGFVTPGAINGAMFLSNFVDKAPWAHIDIAGPAWFTEEKEYTPKGATGYGVRLILQLLAEW